MARNILILSKVIGTVSLGLLAGVSITSVVSLPVVASAPVDNSHNLTTTTTDGDAATSSESSSPSLVESFYLRLKKLTCPLTVAAFVSLSCAYIFAPSYGRHPYLIYSALSVPLSRYISLRVGQQAIRDVNSLRSASASTVPQTAGSAPAKSSTPSEAKEHKVVEDVPSMLDNSVYGRLETEPDAETEGESSPVPVQNRILSTHLTATAVKSLQQKELWASFTALVGFIISTIGIYGDLA